MMVGPVVSVPIAVLKVGPFQFEVVCSKLLLMRTRETKSLEK